MRKVLIVCCVAILSLTFACKKSENSVNKSRREMLLGTWKWTGYGPDSVNLNLLDPNETDSFTIFTYVYKDSSKGLRIEKLVSGSTTYIDTLEFTWLLSQDESSIVSSYTDPLLPNIDSIHTLTDSKLILLDNSKDKGGAFNYWKVMEKL